MNFGAFVQIADGIEGLVHISEIVADRRLNHPSDALRAGQVVKAQVLAIDPEKRQIKLSHEAAHPHQHRRVHCRAEGRATSSPAASSRSRARRRVVELGEGIRATCKIKASAAVAEDKSAAPASGKPDLSSLSSMLKARWKGNAPAASTTPEPIAEGQIRSFKITKLDVEAKKIEVELA